MQLHFHVVGRVSNLLVDVVIQGHPKLFDDCGCDFVVVGELFLAGAYVEGCGLHGGEKELHFL